MTTEPLEEPLPVWGQRLASIVATELSRMPDELVAEGRLLLDLDPSMPQGVVCHSDGDGWLHLTWAQRHIASVWFVDLFADDAEA